MKFISAFVAAAMAGRVTIESIDNPQELIQARAILKAAGCYAPCVDKYTQSVKTFDSMAIQGMCACPTATVHFDDVQLGGNNANNGGKIYSVF